MSSSGDDDTRAAFLEQVQAISLHAAREARKNGSTGPCVVDPRAAEDADSDPNLPQPVPTAEMFYGLVGEVARAASQHTEVNPAAAAAGFLSFLGANMGRDVYYAVGDVHHHPRLFTLHVGRSSRGGKGEALRLTRRIRSAIQDILTNQTADPNLLGQMHTGGLSSREGLVMAIHDEYTHGREIIQEIPDKRLWIIESEFSNVLHQSRRDGNTLSAGLRDLWDGTAIKPLTKGPRIGATHPHVGLAAAITPSELLDLIQARDLSNGFLNRFLLFWAERTRDEPEPQPTSKAEVAGLAQRTAEIIQFAKGNYPKTHDSRAMQMSRACRELWRGEYPGLRKPLETELLGTLLERRAPYAIRLAMLFALSDPALVIEAEHLRAALAWVKYWTASVRFIFSAEAREAKATERDRMARQILEFLAKRPEGASLQDVTNLVFKKARQPIPVVDVLQEMTIDPRYGIEMVEVVRQDGIRGGRRKKVYKTRLTCPGVCGVSEFEAWRGLQGILGDRSLSEFAEFDPSAFNIIPQTPTNSEQTPTQKNVCRPRGISNSETPQTPGQVKRKNRPH